MSNVTTATTTEAATSPAPAVKPTPKFQSAVSAYLDLQVQVGRKFEGLIEQCTKDRNELGYNRDQARVVIQSAFTTGYEALAKRDKLDANATKAYVDAGMKKSGPDISKVLTLSFPKTDDIAKELTAADAEGFGINAKLKIASGNATVESIKAERANKATGAAPETARPLGNATHKPAPTAPTPETQAVAKLTPKERAVTQFIGVIKFCEADPIKLTLEEIEDLFSETLADIAATRREAAEAAPSK